MLGKPGAVTTMMYKYIDDILKLATSAMTEKPLSPFHTSSTILFSVVTCTYNASFYCAAQ